MEVAIAIFVRDRIIRPYGGDISVVLFLYCFPSYLIGWMQYLELRQLLLLEDNVVAQTLLGTNFEWLDMLIYPRSHLYFYY